MIIGLYRDDGLVILDMSSDRLGDKARKDHTHAFNKLGLNITAQANQLQLSTNFLDITFDLTNGTYKPYRKPNEETLYINRHSNHPPPIIRELPISVNKHINSLSCNKEFFYTRHLCISFQPDTGVQCNGIPVELYRLF